MTTRSLLVAVIVSASAISAMAACPDFVAAPQYSAANTPQTIALGDFNGDSKSDLVVSNYGSNNVSVLMNLGDGTFGTATNYVVGTNPTGVAVGDVNGDGFKDIIVANYGSNDVSTLLGNGNGTFSAALSSLAG